MARGGGDELGQFRWIVEGIEMDIADHEGGDGCADRCSAGDRVMRGRLRWAMRRECQSGEAEKWNEGETGEFAHGLQGCSSVRDASEVENPM